MDTAYFARLQAVLIIHVPVRLRNFDIKDSSYFGNGNQFLFDRCCLLIRSASYSSCGIKLMRPFIALNQLRSQIGESVLLLFCVKNIIPQKMS
jgi:hypothetical protein